MTESKPQWPAGHNEPCYYCGEPCNDLAGNPNRWSVPFCHSEAPGFVKWHHVGCVTERLVRNYPASATTSPIPPERVPEALTRGARVYLAARYSRFVEMQVYRADLARLGYTTISRWINGGHELTKEGSTEAQEAERTRYAQEDMADLMLADICISFTEVPRTTTTRGGRHVEHGMALAAGKRTIVVGHQENVFHCLPQVEFYLSWSDALHVLIAEASRLEAELAGKRSGT